MAINDAATSAAVERMLRNNNDGSELHIQMADDETIHNVRTLKGAAAATKKYENVGVTVFDEGELTDISTDNAAITRNRFVVCREDKKNNMWTMKFYNFIPGALNSGPVIVRIPAPAEVHV